ncbi:MAG TPA: hypothetical protein VIF57_09155, partial [Polyangia bacterium]
MLALVVVCAPPMLSSDLYRQAAYGRMVAHHHLNPYATPVNAIPHDPAFALANHPHLTTHYGPAYTLLSALLAALAPSTALGLAVAWKAAAACGALACAFMVAPLARALDGAESDGRNAQLWVAWNPLLVIESAVSAHPEPIMMFAALAGILVWQRGRPARGAIVLVVSTLTKWITGLVLVFAIVREAAQARPATAGRRLRVLLALGAAAGLTAALLYLPFIRGLAARGGISDLAMRGSATVGSRPLNPMPQWASLAGFAVLVLAALRFVARGGWPRLIATATALTLVFITLVNPWPFPWYFLTPFILVATLPPSGAAFFLRALTAGIAALSLLLMYTRLIPWP